MHDPLFKNRLRMGEQRFRIQSIRRRIGGWCAYAQWHRTPANAQCSRELAARLFDMRRLIQQASPHEGIEVCSKERLLKAPVFHHGWRAGALHVLETFQRNLNGVVGCQWSLPVRFELQK